MGNLLLTTLVGRLIAGPPAFGPKANCTNMQSWACRAESRLFSWLPRGARSESLIRQPAVEVSNQALEVAGCVILDIQKQWQRSDSMPCLPRIIYVGLSKDSWGYRQIETRYSSVTELKTVSPHIVVVAVWALAILWAVDGSLEAFAVLLQAIGLLAVAAFVVPCRRDCHGCTVSLLLKTWLKFTVMQAEELPKTLASCRGCPGKQVPLKLFLTKTKFGFQ